MRAANSCRGNGAVAPLILNLGTVKKVSGQPRASGASLFSVWEAGWAPEAFWGFLNTAFCDVTACSLAVDSSVLEEPAEDLWMKRVVSCTVLLTFCLTTQHRIPEDCCQCYASSSHKRCIHVLRFFGFFGDIDNTELPEQNVTQAIQVFIVLRH